MQTAITTCIFLFFSPQFMKDNVLNFMDIQARSYYESEVNTFYFKSWIYAMYRILYVSPIGLGLKNYYPIPLPFFL